MIRFLRTVSNKSRWDRSDDKYSWLPLNSAPGDILKDLVPENGELSIWRVKDDDDITKILTGIAMTKNSIGHQECILWDESILVGSSFKIEQTVGKTIYTEINELHWNIVELTADRTANLANLLWPVAQQDRRIKAEVEAQIRNVCTAKWFQLNLVPDPNVRTKIQQFIDEQS